MSTRVSWRRWWSRRFTAAAAALLPRLESPWGDAMKAEIEAIEDDRDCLRWAWGCLRTACVRRIGAGLRDHRVARALVAGYLLLVSIGVFWVFSAGVVYQMGGGPAFFHIPPRVDPMRAQMLALAFDSVPIVICFFVSGALLLTSALAVVMRRLRTAAELLIVQFALDWVLAVGTYLFVPAVSALFLPTHLSLSNTIHLCVILGLWCARSVERERHLAD